MLLAWTFCCLSTLSVYAKECQEDLPQPIDHTARCMSVKLAQPYNNVYSGGGAGALTDGLLGNTEKVDVYWQGFKGVDLDAIIDLGEVVNIGSLSSRYLQHVPGGIFLPQQVEYALSRDGEHFSVVAVVSNTVPIAGEDVSVEKPGPLVREYAADVVGATARYVRVRAKNIGAIPEWHAATGAKAWLFVDEVVVNPAVQASAQAKSMFIKPTKGGLMWDTWLVVHEGTYYLFYLTGNPQDWYGISLLTSEDGVTWNEVGLVLPKADDADRMGCCSVWKSPDYDKSGKFIMNFSEWRSGPQSIFFAESTDLVHWKRLGNDYEFKPDPRWYDGSGRWDGIRIFDRPRGGYYGVMSCSGPMFALAESLDGLTWQALPPPAIDWKGHQHTGWMESAGLFVHKGKYYQLISAWLDDHAGIHTLVSDKLEGPFQPAEKNLHFSAPLRAENQGGYPGFWHTPEGILCCTYLTPRYPNGQFWSGDHPDGLLQPLKKLIWNEEGTLLTAWWPGNEKLKTESIELTDSEQTSTCGDIDISILGNSFDVDRGVILEGMLTVPPDGQSKAGIFIEYADGRSIAILVTPDGVTEKGYVNDKGFTMADRIDRGLKISKTPRFRLLIKHSLLEFYLDDIMMLAHSASSTAAGKIGLIGQSAPVNAKLEAWNTSHATKKRRAQEEIRVFTAETQQAQGLTRSG